MVAQESSACFDVYEPSSSICYVDGGGDLTISLMFKKEEDAIKFVAQLANYEVYNKFRGGISYDREPTPVCLNGEQFSQVKHVLIVDYKHVLAVHSSPENSHVDSLCNSEITNDQNPDKGFRSLENLTMLAPRETIYQCHIASVAHYKIYENDKNNIIYGSHLFHIYFDGDGKTPPLDSSPHWGRCPELALEFMSIDEVPYNTQGTQYRRVNVRVIFRDPAIARAMDHKWRDGTQMEGELSMISYFYTTDSDAVEKYLRIKYFETSRRWQHADGEEVDFEELYPA